MNPVRFRMSLLLPLLGLIAGTLALAGCGSGPIPGADPTTGADSGVPLDPAQPRAKLAARAAAAKDLRQVALYIWKAPGRADRTVTVSRAVDGTWQVHVPGGAHSGTVDVTLVSIGDVLHQCVVPAATHPHQGCVRLENGLPSRADPTVSHVFSDWLEVLTDQRLALAVSLAEPLEGAGGECYAVESSGVALPLPIDAGIYCYERDGTLTAARLSVGTLLLSGPPGAPPATLALPGPLVPGEPLPLQAPPSPSPSASTPAVP